MFREFSSKLFLFDDSMNFECTFWNAAKIYCCFVFLNSIYSSIWEFKLFDFLIFRYKSSLVLWFYPCFFSNFQSLKVCLNLKLCQASLIDRASISWFKVNKTDKHLGHIWRKRKTPRRKKNIQNNIFQWRDYKRTIILMYILAEEKLKKQKFILAYHKVCQVFMRNT